MPPALIIFDVDGTLAETYSLDLLTGVREFFQLLTGRSCPARPQIAIATNQGGVGMRRWMEMGNFGNPEKFPTQAEVEARLDALLAALGLEPSLPVYVSYRYQTKQGKWVPVPPEGRGSPRWKSEWRKPGGGMLSQAMQDAGVQAQDTLFVGDSEEDQQAAQAAGCAFEWAERFFGRDWQDCNALADR